MLLLYNLPHEVLYVLGTLTTVLGVSGTALFAVASKYFWVKRKVSCLVYYLSMLSTATGAMFFNTALFGISGKIGSHYYIDDLAFVLRPFVLFAVLYYFIKITYEIFKSED